MNMKLKKMISLAVVCMMVISIFAACGGGGGTSQAPAGNAGASGDGGSAGDTTIRIMTRWSDDAPFSVYFRNQIAEFNNSGRGITIVDESLSEEAAYLDKLRTSIATGNQPEIFIEYGGSRIIDYVEAGILLDFQPYLDADPEWRDSFLDDLFDKWHFDEYPGTFGIPCQFYAVLLFYNKELLAANGFDGPPESLDEWRHMNQTMLDNGQQPMTLGERDVWRGGHFLNNLVMKGFGAQGVTDIANRTMNYDDPGMIELLAIIKEFNDSGFFGPNAVGVDVNTEDTDFLTNKTALRFIGTWFIPQVVADYEGDINNIGVARFPYINQQFRNSWQGGTAESYSISDRPETNGQAVEVVKFLTSPEFFAGAEAFCQGGVYVSRFETLSGVEIDPLTTATKALLLEATEFRDDIQTYDPESHMMDTVRNAIQGLFIGNSPEQVAQEIVSRQQVR